MPTFTNFFDMEYDVMTSIQKRTILKNVDHDQNIEM
jgi:hypothetical protein